MNKKDKYIIIINSIISIILIMIFSFYLIKYLKIAFGSKDNILYNASITDNSSYKVDIKNNPYLEDDILYLDKAYITDLVDSISINYKYNYNLKQDINLNYDYKIIATIIGNYDEALTKPIWTKDYLFLNKNDLSNKSSIMIDETIDIQIDQFNELVTSFINDYNINLLANLEVKLIVNINNINKNHYVSVHIPLNEKAFDIEINKNFADEEIEYKNTPLKKEVIFVKLIIYISLIISVIIIYMLLFKNIINKSKSKYVLERDKILKDYSERIIEVSNFIKYTKWETVTVKNFKELTELSNEAFEPIFFWERKNNKQKEAWFCILRDSVLYKYILYSKYEIKED